MECEFAIKYGDKRSYLAKVYPRLTSSVQNQEVQRLYNLLINCPIRFELFNHFRFSAQMNSGSTTYLHMAVLLRGGNLTESQTKSFSKDYIIHAINIDPCP